MLKSKCIMPWDRLLIHIVYKYNSQEVISFFTKGGTGRTEHGIPYFSKYPEMFDNIYIQLVAHTQIVSKFFGSVSEIETHKKFRQ